jgi:bisphosphoglycerate-dependent phosphoglycerate mutase
MAVAQTSASIPTTCTRTFKNVLIDRKKVRERKLNFTGMKSVIISRGNSIRKLVMQLESIKLSSATLAEKASGREKKKKHPILS